MPSAKRIYGRQAKYSKSREQRQILFGYAETLAYIWTRSGQI